jgi:hypothetical protein
MTQSLQHEYDCFEGKGFPPFKSVRCLNSQKKQWKICINNIFNRLTVINNHWNKVTKIRKSK